MNFRSMREIIKDMIETFIALEIVALTIALYINK